LDKWRRRWEKKLVKKKGGHSIEKDEDDEDLQMLNIVP
jgi:hypothetical protein